MVLIGSLWSGASAQTQSPKRKPAAKPQTTQKASVKKTPTRKLTDGKTAVKLKPKPSATPKPVDPAVEKAKFDAAIATVRPTEKAVSLVKFIAEFPKSEYAPRAKESLAGARAAMADERLSSGETAEGIRLFKLVINDAPKPYSDRLFAEIISTIPENLFWRGQQQAAVEFANTIETNVSANQKQLLALANFFLRTENGTEAKRIAEAAIKLDETSSAAHQSLGMTHRLNFDLEEAERSFTKAVELDANSTTAKRMLGEMKRALGKAEEASALYGELVAKDENDNAARTGLILSLFENGKRTEAEAELSKAIEKTPGNVVLLASAAYWYAANGNGDKAIELARSAIEKEPRFVWSHIALARGLMLQKRPVDAEQVLVAARKFGNFPTLQYEIASARLAAGFFREAAEELQKSFATDADGLHTRLGGRVERSGKSFTDLVSAERKASIFSAVAADTAESAEILKALLDLQQATGSDKPDEANVVAAAERFVNGTDEMAVHRKLFSAKVFIQKKIAGEKALEYSRSATTNVDTALNVASPAAAIMANELYEAREDSFSKNQFLLIPEVPKQTLSAILRGRIEETTGLALLQTGNAADATIRFRRALSVLPKDSAWWRSATWNLGSALEAEGKNEEALTTYISSYKIDKPDLTRYITISSLYKKIKGNTDGLEDQIGPSPLGNTVAETSAPQAANEKVAEPAVEKPADTQPAASPSPKIDEAAGVTTEKTVANTPQPSPTPETSPSIEPLPSTSTTPEVSPTVETKSANDPTASNAETPKNDLVKEVIPPPLASPTPKPLFEPIIITIPNSGKKGNGNKPAQNADAQIRSKTRSESEKTEDSKKPDEQVQEKPSQEKPNPDESIVSGALRPRVVEGKEITGGEIQPCAIEVSQDSVSVINDGGSIALLLSVPDKADIKAITAVSNSIKDIEVTLDPEIAGVSTRALYVIKSISPNTGIYQVNFELPCGRKVVTVRVR